MLICKEKNPTYKLTLSLSIKTTWIVAVETSKSMDTRVVHPLDKFDIAYLEEMKTINHGILL